ncbi:MAG: DDE-type integrase/transposase/recombinase [Pseudonocardia sp.]|nr:DDE-type integrase/transposase/recombinase [Pseudonocardia sp.]
MIRSPPCRAVHRAGWNRGVFQGKNHYLWRAVDQDGTVLDILVTSLRDAKAAAQKPWVAPTQPSQLGTTSTATRHVRELDQLVPALMRATRPRAPRRLTR